MNLIELNVWLWVGTRVCNSWPQKPVPIENIIQIPKTYRNRFSESTAFGNAILNVSVLTSINIVKNNPIVNCHIEVDITGLVGCQLIKMGFENFISYTYVRHFTGKLL